MKNLNPIVFDVERLDRLLSDDNLPQLKEQLLLLLKNASGIDWIFLLDKYVSAFPEDEIIKTPQFTTFAAVSASIKGDIGRAQYYAQLLDTNLLLSHYINVYMPYTDNKTFRKSIVYLTNTHNFHATFNSSRPSIINSLRDYSCYNRFLEHSEKAIKKMAYGIYGNQSIGMYEVALAEYYYQVNRCYDALALVDSVINDLQHYGNSSVLAAALHVQLNVFLVKGQAKDFHTMVDDYEFRISKVNYTLYPRYMEALRVWCALYSGQYDYCEDWLLNRAPRDTDVLTILDIYNVLVKLRIYLLLGKYYLVISIAVRLIPTLEDWHRTMDACETRLIYAMALFSDNNLEKAYEVLDGVLPVIKRFHYYRLVADEGQKMYNMLRLYKKSRRTNDGFIDLLISLSKQMGIMYPNYLKKLSENYPSLTDTEKSVLRLMADERTNADIADYMSVSINTVKFHSKNIFMKLNVNNRHQAIKIALESNII